MVRVLWRFSSFPAAQMLALTVQGCLPQVCWLGHFLHIFPVKNVPKTASTPYGWCPSPVLDVHKSSEVAQTQERGESNISYIIYRVQVLRCNNCDCFGLQQSTYFKSLSYSFLLLLFLCVFLLVTHLQGILVAVKEKC